MGKKDRGPGVCLVQRPKGTGCWYVGVNFKREDGRWSTKWVATGTHDQELARRLFYDPAVAVASGRRAQEVLRQVMPPEAMRIEVPLVDLWSFYEAHAQEKASANTENLRRQRVAAFVGWMGRKHPEVKLLREVSIRLAGEFWRELEERQLAGATRNTWKAMLAMVWKQVAVPAELETNPWDKIVRDRAEGTSYRALSLGEVERLVEVSRGFPSQVPGFWPLAIQIGMETGLREGDIAGLRGSSFRWGDGILAVVPGKTEKKTRRMVSYHSLERPWVKELPRVVGEGFLWPAAGEVAKVQGERFLCDEFKAICALAGIQTDRAKEAGERRQQDVKLVSFHSLRHTFVTLLMQSGAVDHATLVAQGNWSTEAVVKGVYDGAKAQQGVRAALAVAEAWERIMG